MFQAMVSVMAVKIQFSSPRGVLRSVCLPGMRSMSSLVSPSCLIRLREQNQRSAICTHTALLALLALQPYRLHHCSLVSSADLFGLLLFCGGGGGGGRGRRGGEG